MVENTKRSSDYSLEIQEVRAGNRKWLHQLYTSYQNSFVEWSMARYRCGQSEAEDVFQDVMIAFYENIVEGKIESLRSHIRTYLFGIGRILLIKKFQAASKKKNVEISTISEEEIGSLRIEQELELSERQELMRAAIAQLGESCRDLLTLFYYHRYNNESIKNTLGFKNTHVVKSKKVRCMNRLRGIIQQHFDRESI